MPGRPSGFGHQPYENPNASTAAYLLGKVLTPHLRKPCTEPADTYVVNHISDTLHECLKVLIIIILDHARFACFAMFCSMEGRAD